MNPFDPAVRTVLLAAIAFITLSCVGASTGTHEVQVRAVTLDQPPAGEVVAPAFSPDGKSVFFGRNVGDGIFIFTSEKIDGRWTTPKAAPFSGTYKDLEPALAPSGKYLIFCIEPVVET